MSDKKIKLSAVKGMNDILPAEAVRWEALETIIREVLHDYGFQNIRTPIVELTPLYVRGLGEATDVVEKEMYNFTDKLNGDPLCLRPEFTAGIVRAAIEHNMTYDRPQRVYSMGPAFRHERPQRGRYRQFHQLSVEALGMSGPDVDAELIFVCHRLWKRLGLNDVRLELNSLGSVTERAEHRQALITYLEKFKDQLDEDGLRRMYVNPLRVLDTKNPRMQEIANHAPRLIDFLGNESLAHFNGLCQLLDDAGISYTVNPRIVRGLDYYNLTVFEWITDSLGSQGTICGGGRYDGLFEMIGGKPTPAVGFGLGLERLLECWQQVNPDFSVPEASIYVIHQGVLAARQAPRVAEMLRDAGFSVLMNSGGSSFKSQMKRADASGATLAVIIGDDEVEAGVVTIKQLRNIERSAEQSKVALSDMVFELSNYLSTDV